MPQCVAWKCRNKTGKTIGKSFHRFPKDPEKRKVWVDALRREGFQAGVNTRLCGDHFEEHCFILTGKTKRLHDDAVPTIFDFPSHLQKKIRHRKPPRKRLPLLKVRFPKPRRWVGTEVPTLQDGADHLSHPNTDQEHCKANPLGHGHPNIDTLGPGHDPKVGHGHPNRDTLGPGHDPKVGLVGHGRATVGEHPKFGSEHSYSVISPPKLKKRLDQATDTIEYIKKKLKTAQNKNRRLQKRVDALKAMVALKIKSSPNLMTHAV